MDYLPKHGPKLFHPFALSALIGRPRTGAQRWNRWPALIKYDKGSNYNQLKYFNYVRILIK